MLLPSLLSFLPKPLRRRKLCIPASSAAAYMQTNHQAEATLVGVLFLLTAVLLRARARWS